jgi:hypothetical protein
MHYSEINSLVRNMAPGSTDWQPVVSLLTYTWLDDYERVSLLENIVTTQAGGFSYLFDIDPERLIAAWGVSQGRSDERRDSNRMAGHPNSAGPLYHRGHAIPHTLGGGLDINLVAQLGRINIGPFRPLERRAVATPDSFYFTYWTYLGSGPAGQTPTGVDQGLLIAGQTPDILHHGN